MNNQNNALPSSGEERGNRPFRRQQLYDNDDALEREKDWSSTSRSGSFPETSTALASSSSLGGEPLPLDENESGNKSCESASRSPRQQQQQVRELRQRKVSLTELVNCLNHPDEEQQSTTMDPELYRRLCDFRLAQQKRLEKYGPTQKWGIYGVYLHLAHVKTDLEWAEDAAWRRWHNQPYCSWSDFDALKQRKVVPYFTYLFMIVVTVLLLVEFAVNNWKMEPLDVNPLMGPSAETLIRMGALDTPKIVEDGQWYRLLTASLLHAGIVHWIVNVAALFFFGGVVEQCHGTWIAALLFWVPAVGGNLLSAIFLPQYISVGASGGIFGFMGASVADISMHWNLIFLQPQQHDDTSQETSHQTASSKRRNVWAFFWMGVEIVVNVLLGLTPYIDNFIHLGGFVYGLLGGWSVIEYDSLSFLGYQASLYTKVRMLALRFVGLLACLLFIVITSIFLATMELGDTPCPSCRYFNCVPFPSANEPWWRCDDCIRVSAELFRTAPTSSSSDINNKTNITTTTTLGYYSRVELTCPNDAVETINVTSERITDKRTITEHLPEYCREYCDELYTR